jgi:hypothetical protein
MSAQPRHGSVALRCSREKIVTLEELRIQLLDSVKNCRDPHAVAQLLAEAERTLNDSRVGEVSKGAFWDAVEHDLDVVTQEASVILGTQAALTVRAVIGAARTGLGAYRRGPDQTERS